MNGGDSQGPNGGWGLPQLPGEVQRCLGQVPDQMGWDRQLDLAGAVAKCRVPDCYLYAAGIEPAAAQAGGHRV